MAITYTDSGTHVVTTSASYTLTLPTYAANDVLAVFTASEGLVSAPTGWTQAYSNSAPDGKVIRMFWIAATSSSSVSNPVLARSGGTNTWVYVGKFTGADNTTPFGTAGFATAGSSSTHTTASVTTTVANSLVFIHAEIDGGKYITGLTNSNLTGIVDVTHYNGDLSSSFTYSDHSWSLGTLATAGSAGASTMTVYASNGGTVGSQGASLANAWSAAFAVNAPAPVPNAPVTVCWF